MFCSQCGAQTPDDANFCHKCGKPLRPSAEMPVTVNKEPKFETCEIVFELVKKGFLWNASDLKFWARAISSRGEYCAGESGIWQYGADWPMSNSSEAVAEHRKLVSKLVQDGWQPVGRGQEWYNDRFRRNVK